MLAVEGAVVQFDGRTVVDGVDLTVGDGETVGVLGPSGCGKTTLLRVIAGLQRLEAGRVTWDGDDLAAVPPHERRFGLVFQEYALFPHRDVKGNVEFGLRMAGETAAKRTARVDEVLDLVGLAELRDRRVALLSGGEQQRVALARALAVSPRLLMLDEPLGALDRAWRTRLLTELRAILDAERLAALYVTHDHDEAFAIASRVLVMRGGRVVQQGAPADVWRQPADAWVATFLGFGPAITANANNGRIETPWGAFPTAASGPVEVVLRPDAVRIAPDGVIPARVTRVAVGALDVEVTAAPAGDGPPLVVHVAHRDAPRVGEEIALTIDADAVLVYPVCGRLRRMASEAKVEEGASIIAKRDKVMRRMVREHGVPDLHTKRGGRNPHFAELARMICYQQLAGRAAAAIHGRFDALFDGHPTPEAVLALPVETLRGVGLSGSKAASIIDLATKVEEGLVELDRVAKLPDEEVVRELVLVRGIGEWTAHMFLMFQMGRLDVWPTGDFGVRNGYGRLYGIDPMPTPKQLQPEGDRFRPYRSLVAWYCWREVDVEVPD